MYFVLPFWFLASTFLVPTPLNTFNVTSLYVLALSDGICFLTKGCPSADLYVIQIHSCIITSKVLQPQIKKTQIGNYSLLPYKEFTTTFGFKLPRNFYPYSQPNYKSRNVVFVNQVMTIVFLGGRQGPCTLIDKPTLFSDKTVSC